MLKRDLVPVKNILIGCLNSYRAESRNNLFHKDCFDRWEKVEQIRKNTLFLYVVLLGTVDPNIIMADESVLNIINIEYDQLLRMLDEQKNGIYSFMLEGKKYSEMRKEPRHDGLSFNKEGLITNTIVFKKDDYDRLEEIEISREKIPSEVWTTDDNGEKNIVWSLKKKYSKG